MFRVRSAFLVSFLAAPLVSAPQFARAADFYKDKTLTIIVGMSAGGGYDAYARGLASHLADHIPGNPTIVVQNMPGAGSFMAVRALGATEPKDGTVMVSFDPGLITQSLVQPDKVNFDFRKFAWIGIVTPDFRVCYGFGPNGVKSWDDLMHRKQFFLGATGNSSGGYVNGATLREVLNAPVKQILGFPGSAELRIAIEQGELDGDCGAFSSIPMDWVRDHKAHPFVRFTKERLLEIPESAVFIDDLTEAKDEKDLLDVLDAEDEVGRVLVMSSQVPADRVDVIREAFNATMKDPAFLADMNKQQLPVNPLTGQATEQIVSKMLNASPAVLARAKQFYE